jgi:hypothetical protein
MKLKAGMGVVETTPKSFGGDLTIPDWPGMTRPKPPPFCSLWVAKPPLRAMGWFGHPRSAMSYPYFFFPIVLKLLLFFFILLIEYLTRYKSIT